MAESKLQALINAFMGAERVLIVPHNDPDPDAIASALALRTLLEHSIDAEIAIGYQGIIGRSENKALVRYLGHPMRHIAVKDWQSSAIALVDCQPGSGNNPIPADVPIAAVIDHHGSPPSEYTAAFVDLRHEVGATATILGTYLQEAGLELSTSLATALFYAIKTDTMGLARGASQADIDMYFYLQPRIDVEALAEIERAQVPAAYFRSLVGFLRSTRLYDSALIACAGEMDYPDLAAEIADLLLRLQGVRWVVCSGIYRDELVLSVRTRSPRSSAEKMVQKIVQNRGAAGGHGSMAAGHIPLQGQDPKELQEEIRRGVLRFLEQPLDDPGEPLLSSPA